MNVTIVTTADSRHHVHAEGCKDLDRNTDLPRETLDAPDRRSIVLEFYPPEGFDYDPDDWRDQDTSIIFKPCVTLPDEATT